MKHLIHFGENAHGFGTVLQKTFPRQSSGHKLQYNSMKTGKGTHSFLSSVLVMNL